LQVLSVASEFLEELFRSFLLGPSCARRSTPAAEICPSAESMRLPRHSREQIEHALSTGHCGAMAAKPDS
jgi:hypothetical protein